MALLTLVIYALFKDYKRNSLDTMVRATHTDYQKFQYFFSDSKWDILAIKRTRREIIQKQGTTAPTKNGFLAIDDTGCPKPFAKKTEGAQLQYCGLPKRKEVCNVGVGAAFVSDSKHFPIDTIPYLPTSEFPRGKNNSQVKDKIQIARELFDLSAENFALSGKELKDTFYLDHYQVRHINKIERYWNLCHVAWTFTYGIKQNVYLTKILETKPKTFNEIKQAINAMLEFASTNALSKNEKLADSYFKIKSK